MCEQSPSLVSCPGCAQGKQPLAGLDAFVSWPSGLGECPESASVCLLDVVDGPLYNDD